MLIATTGRESPRDRAHDPAVVACWVIPAAETRIDRWLCAVRLVKTRPPATQLCQGGHVRVNGNRAKAATKVRAGDVV